MTNLDHKAAFIHVIDSYRWLAASGCAWNLVGPNATTEMKDKVDELIPNFDVMIRDCCLLHARSLVDFYTKDEARAFQTDILLSAFQMNLDGSLKTKIERYKQPIEAHLLHLTDWRDPGYRHAQSSTPKGAARTRLNWDIEITQIVEDILSCLASISPKVSSSWPIAFKALYDASIARYRNKSFDWPADLTPESGLKVYFKHIGL